MTTKTLILSGYGLNCERETEHCCSITGKSHVTVKHLAHFLSEGAPLMDYDFLVCIGGFLDGDDLGAGRVGANRFKYAQTHTGHLQDQLASFIEAKRLILGICNGFQLLVKLGALPASENTLGTQEVSLTHNLNGQFEDRWVRLSTDSQSPCVFTQGLGHLELPIRHGEGRIVASESMVQDLHAKHQVALAYVDESGIPTERYPENPNGSPLGIAALCNQTGNVMGMMPHPEAYHHYTNHPQWTRRSVVSEEGEGLQLFQKAYEYLG